MSPLIIGVDRNQRPFGTSSFNAPESPIDHTVGCCADKPFPVQGNIGLSVSPDPFLQLLAGHFGGQNMETGFSRLDEKQLANIIHR